MRSSVLGFLLLLLTASVFAADLKVKVLDPQSAAVAGAEVLLLRAGEKTIVSSHTTSADGTTTFHTETDAKFQIKVLAPGFAEEAVEVSKQSELTVNLRVVSASEAIIVSATRTPVPGEAAGADVDSLSNLDLTALQPIAAADAVRILPGAVINTAGQHGGIASLFVRGGASTYNKVIVDGVAIDNPGLTFDFGTLSLTEADRLEFVRGAQSTLYGSDAMTSVIQVWTRTGSTVIPELRLGADGGNFGTANGNVSLSGAYRRFDYNTFASQFNTNGQGVNDAYSNSLQGANVGMAIDDQVALRVRVRHSNSYTGVPGEWSFNGYDPLVFGLGVPLQPDPSEWSHQNNLLGSVELSVNAPSGWQHRLTAFDSLYRYTDTNLNSDFSSYDSFPDRYDTHDNRVGFEYQGDYSERTWAHTTFGYRLENENGLVNDQDFPPEASGQRLDQEAYLQQQFTFGRLSVIAGGRFIHNSAYGNAGVPRVALTLLAARGGELFSGTRLRFSYATGFMEPAIYQVFGEAGFGYAPNPGLLPERTRAFEAGFEQKFFTGRWALNATYFNNLFHDQIEAIPNTTGEYQFFNLEQSFAHGAELELQGRIASKLSLTTAYTYTSSEILDNPNCPPPSCFPYDPGDPLILRPKHSATTRLTYFGTKWGANLAGSFVGRRADSDFDGLSIDHAAGYARVDLGGWYAINSTITAYASVQNALNDHYNEVLGYPALSANFRAGFRFRFGGDR
jgi:vitamin B12 transporter